MPQNDALSLYQMDRLEPGELAGPFTVDAAPEAQRFHSSFPQYQPTPLHALPALAHAMGVRGVFVKDESARFGLNAFKVLGGSYCVGKYMARRLSCELSELPYAQLVSAPVRQRLGEITFVTATDGNHGRGVAWAARQVGQKSVVYMPKGSSPERLENIRRLGAQAEITPWNYDDTVRFARRQAQDHGWVLMQDTAWPGYTQIPAWIMQGYLTLGAEILDQLGGDRPTHVFLQAGVGSMAAALAAYFVHVYGADCPTLVLVESNQADCLYRTARADDGQLHGVDGDLRTIMAGLACGEPCSIAWELLRRYVPNYLTIPDYVAARGMRILAAPLGADPRIVSGESGASTLGAAAELLTDERWQAIRQAIGLGAEAKILVISTEGDTDRAHYRRIVWDGLYPKP
ncbi:MAG: diaminopropionate ammonia-lyase [Christensenellales bacterium]|jgi:diaminopropionate ammonia-lyase